MYDMQDNILAREIIFEKIRASLSSDCSEKKNQSQQHFKHRAEYYYLKDKIGRGQFPLPLMNGTEQWLKGFLFGRYK